MKIVKYLLTASLFLTIFILSNVSSAVEVPVSWDKSDSAEYYILELTADQSFAEIIKIYKPKENNLTVDLTKGTYFLKVTPIASKENGPSIVITVTVDDKGKASVSNPSAKPKAVVSEKTSPDRPTPPIKQVDNASKPSSPSAIVNSKGLMYHKACWDASKQIWVLCD